jgi:hypothetical protein
VKISCVSLGDPSRDGGAWLTLGREYLVLSILAVPGNGIRFRIVADNGRTPILEDSSLFRASNVALPISWVASVSADGVLEIGPARWLTRGYWERYFDRDEEAVAIFEEEVAAMKH